MLDKKTAQNVLAMIQSTQGDPDLQSLIQLYLSGGMASNQMLDPGEPDHIPHVSPARHEAYGMMYTTMADAYEANLAAALAAEGIRVSDVAAAIMYRMTDDALGQIAFQYQSRVRDPEWQQAMDQYRTYTQAGVVATGIAVQSQLSQQVQDIIARSRSRDHKRRNNLELLVEWLKGTLE